MPATPGDAPAGSRAEEIGLRPALTAVVHDASPIGWVVVDFETTGTISRTNRVIEIGAVQVEPDGSIGASWGTLVNPRRDIGPTSIHGIRAGDVLGAPTFAEVAADFLDFLDGRLFAAHNASFDAWFLKLELARLGYDASELGWLDTKRVAGYLGLGTRIDDIAHSLGVDSNELHAAETDALLTAEVLSLGVQAWGATEVLSLARDGGLIDASACQLTGRGCRVVKRGSGPAIPVSSHVLLDELGPLSDPPSNAPLTREAAAWLAMLERAVEDRVLDDEELKALRDFAWECWLSDEQVRTVVHHYFTATVTHALHDGRIDDAERRDLERLAGVLGLDATALIAEVQRDGDGGAEEIALIHGPGLEPGAHICFTGELSKIRSGQHVTRPMAIDIATAHEFLVAANVSKKVDAVICADPDSQSGKARRGRELGIRIIAEQEFWRMLDELDR